MSQEESKAMLETRNVNWRITSDPDGKFPEAQVTHALLIDIRENTRSMRKMMLFFTVLAIVECISLAIWPLLHI